MALNPLEKRNLGLFLLRAKKAIAHMAEITKYPSLKTLYAKIGENLQHVPINIVPGESLDSTGFSTVYGQNSKRLNGGVLQSAIRIPHDHLFSDNGGIKNDGALTLLHEESHIVLPDSAHNFTARIGLPAQHADEFFADVLAAHLAKNMGFPKEVIGRHLYARRSYFGFPIDRFALEGRRGVAKEIEAGRFRPMATRRPEEREPIRAPTERKPWGGLLPSRGRSGPSIFPSRGKRPLREFNRRI